jgi:signal peptidase II
MAAAGAAWARVAAVAAGIVVLDQATKALVRAEIDPGDRRAVLPGVDLVHTRNTGVAFGFLEGGGALIGAITAVALVALLVFFARHRDRPLAWLPTGLLVGGAIGNVIDRLRGGGVVDFLKLPAWPAFNVADIAITGGVLALLLVLERSDDDDAAADRA